MPVRNRSAEMAFEMIIKLAGSQVIDEARRQELWDKCHADRTIQDAVSLYLYSTGSYADKALHKLHKKLMEVITQ
jgi:hypothetical protein